MTMKELEKIINSLQPIQSNQLQLDTHFRLASLIYLLAQNSTGSSLIDKPTIIKMAEDAVINAFNDFIYVSSERH